AAIFAAMLAGATMRPAAAEFAFLVGIPTMFAATGYQMYSDIEQFGADSIDWVSLGLGFAVATVTGFLAVKWLLRYVQSHRFTIFAWYRIVFGVSLLLVL